MHVELFDIQFPHGFVILKGTTDAGVPVDANYGFTATDVSPALVFGPADGEITGAKPSYIAHARSHFSLAISDDRYQAVMAVMAAWRDTPQPSYNLNGHNCMTFVKAVAVAAGLEVSDAPRFMREPSSFLNDMAARNSGIYDAVTPPSAMVARSGMDKFPSKVEAKLIVTSPTWQDGRDIRPASILQDANPPR
jgi:hypothetical protein